MKHLVEFLPLEPPTSLTKRFSESATNACNFVNNDRSDSKKVLERLKARIFFFLRIGAKGTFAPIELEKSFIIGF